MERAASLRKRSLGGEASGRTKFAVSTLADSGSIVEEARGTAVESITSHVCRDVSLGDKPYLRAAEREVFKIETSLEADGREISARADKIPR